METTNISKPILYTYFRSSCTWRVRFVLAWKGIEYESRFTNLLQSQHLSDEYAKLNPYKEVPSLVINGEILTQSIAIMEYLEETYPEKPLLPSDSLKRAQVRAIMNAIACDIHPVQNLRVMNYAVGNDLEARKKWANYWITFGFDGLEKVLEGTAGKFCVGDEITLADACLTSIIYNANRYGVDMSRYPIINKVNEEIKKTDAYRQSRPEVQGDCPLELRELL